jgi:2-dehydro-3-deoxyphosphogluconate aldolase/(4S)-4-hydroxy-2-oxoglutarate aldolase
MPSGGVALENAKDWFDQGAVAIRVGSSLTGPSNASRFAGVAQRARRFVQRVQNIPHQMM